MDEKARRQLAPRLIFRRLAWARGGRAPASSGKNLPPGSTLKRRKLPAMRFKHATGYAL